MDQRTHTIRTVVIVLVVLLALSLLRFIFGNLSASINFLGSGLTAFTSAFGGPSTTANGLTAVYNLTGTAGNGEISLVWANQPGENNVVYYIYRGTTPNNLAYYAETSNTAFVDRNVVNGRTYYYEVAPVAQQTQTVVTQNTTVSNEVALTPFGNTVIAGNTAFAPVMSELAGVAGTGYNSLAWSVQSNGGAGVLGYYVYRSDNGGAMSNIATIDRTSYVDYNVSSGNSYTYEVRAFNRVGRSSPTNEVTLTPSGSVQPTTNNAPGQVTNLSALAGAGEVNLIWSAPNGSSVSYYNIYRSTYSGGEGFVQTVTSPDWTDTNVTNGTTYYYQVAAVNSYGTGSMSNQAVATPYSLINPPSQVSNLVASGGYNQISLTWSVPYSNGQVSGYNIYRSAGNTNDFTYYTETSNNWYTDTSVSGGTTYYYYIVAMNGSGQSGQSNTASAAPYSPNSIPNAVTNLSASPASNSINLTWSYSGSDQAAYYKIYRGTGNGNLGYYASTNGNTASYSDNGASVGTIYYYEVLAVDNSGNQGPFSNEVSASLQNNQPSGPGQVTNLSASAQSGGISLYWTYSGPSVSYFKIYRGVNNSNVTFRTTSGSTNYFDNNVASGNTYYYQVSAVDTSGVEGPLSNIAPASYYVSNPNPQPVSNQTVITFTIGSDTMQVTKNGATTDFTMDSVPTMTNGTIYLPIYYPIESALGGSVYPVGSWSATGPKEAVADWNGHNLDLWIGKTSATLNGSPYVINPAPYLDTNNTVGRSMVPLNVFSGAYGLQTNYSGSTVTLTYNG